MATEFYSEASYIINNLLWPIVSVVQVLAKYIGLFLIISGMTRLYRLGQGQQMMHRVSPLSTAMYFISGTVLIGYTSELTTISNALLPMNNMQNHVLQLCANSPDGQHNDINNNVLFCPMYGYSQDLTAASMSGVDDTGPMIKVLAFAVLFLIGIISFIRGMLELLKLGEGQGGQGAGLPKALTHIIAGAIAVNAQAFYDLLQNTLFQAMGPSLLQNLT